MFPASFFYRNLLYDRLLFMFKRGIGNSFIFPITLYRQSSKNIKNVEGIPIATPGLNLNL